MNQSDQLYINHEVRIQLLEEIMKESKLIHQELSKECKLLRQEMHSQFRWIVTILLGSVLLPILLHWTKLS